MQITALIAQKNDPNRVNVFVDGKFKAGLTLDIVVKNKLKVGNTLDESQLSFLELSSYSETLFSKVLNFISVRPRSEKEVRDYIAKKSKTAKQPLIADKIEAMVARLQDLNYLDDLKFASWWIEQRQTFKPKGKIALKIELAQKGIPREVIEEALANERELLSEEKNALEIAKKRMTRLQSLPKEKQREKLQRYILSRGFSYDTAKNVIDALVNKE